MRTPTSATEQRGRAAGFTLLELLVVMAIISVIVMLALPSIQSVVPGLELRAETEALRRTLRSVRAAAVRDTRETTLTVDTARGIWRNDVTGETTSLSRGTLLSMLTARQEQVGEDIGRIRFFPDGSSTGGRLTLSNGGVSILAIDWIDGQVRLEDAD